MIPSGYRSVFAVPHARPLVLASLAARIPQGIAPLAIVLLVRGSTGSFGRAGLVAGCYAAAGALFAPVIGRLVDRRGQADTLLTCAAVNGAALITLTVLAGGHAGIVSMGVVAAIAGAAIPPVSACMRTLWSSMLDRGPTLETAYALEAVLVEVFFIAGPLLTALLVGVASPSAALLTAAGLTLGGTAAFIASPVARGWQGSPAEPGARGPLRAGGIRTLVLSIVPVGVAFGTLEVSLPAFAEHHGRAANGGVLLALMAAGSMAGGLWYGSRTWTAPLARRYVQLSAVFAAGLALPIAASSLLGMAALMVLAGLALAPAVTCAYSLLDRLAPAGTATEAYTWLTTSNVAGAAIGTAVAGAVIESSGVRWALVGACACAVLGALIAVLGRRSLTPG